MPKSIPGDPLTGVVPVIPTESLPRTQIVVPQDVLGPVRSRRISIRDDRDQWPNVADPMGISMRQLVPGRIASVRTRQGVRTWQVRMVSVSRQGRNKGRHFFVGMDRNGWCHSAWVDRVISVETVQRALAAQRVLKAIGSGSSRPRTQR